MSATAAGLDLAWRRGDWSSFLRSFRSAFLRRIPQADAHVRAGKWPGAEMPLARRMSAQRFGIFGLGRIGKAIARRLEGFGVPIAYSGRAPQDVRYRWFGSLTELAAHSDVLVIAAAASAQTARRVDAEVLAALGPRGVLVNVARGSIVDEPALVKALAEGRLAGAALDVFADEPHPAPALLGMANVVLTPHIASATSDTRQAMADLALANLAAHFAGQPLPSAVA